MYKYIYMYVCVCVCGPRARRRASSAKLPSGACAIEKGTR